MLTLLMITIVCLTGTAAEQQKTPEPAHIAVFEHFASYYSIQGFYHVALPIDFTAFHTACHEYDGALRLALRAQEDTAADIPFLNWQKLRLQSFQTDLSAACADVEAWPTHKPKPTRPSLTRLREPGRVKRSPAAITMKLLKFLGTSLGYFGLNFLWDKVTGDDDARIIAVEDKIAQLSAMLVPAIQTVTNLTKAYNVHVRQYSEARNHETHTDLLHAAIQRFTAQVQTLNLLWATLLTSGRLSPNFMRPAVLQDFHSQIEDLLQDQHQVLFIESPYQLLELPVSILHKDEETYVMLHIPLVDQKMDLHRLIPLPLWLKVGGGEENEVLDIITNTPFIAVSERGVFNSPLTRSQLDSCLPIGANYFCAHPSYFKQFQSSCIGALFAGGLQIALEHCATVRSKTTLVVQDTAAGYVIFSSTRITVFKKCQLLAVEAVTFQGYMVFPFRENCALHSGEIFVPELVPTTLNFSKTAISADVPEFLGVHWEEYLDQRASLEEQDIPLPRDPVEISARFEASHARSALSTGTLVLALLSVMCTAFVFTLLGVKFLLLRRAQHRLLLAATPPSTRSFEMDVFSQPKAATAKASHRRRRLSNDEIQTQE